MGKIWVEKNSGDTGKRARKGEQREKASGSGPRLGVTWRESTGPHIKGVTIRLAETNHFRDGPYLWKSIIRHLNWPAFARERVPLTNAETKSWDCRANLDRGSQIKPTPAPQPERLGNTQLLMGWLLGAQRTSEKEVGRVRAEWVGTPWQQGHLNQLKQSSDELPETEAACTRLHGSAPHGVLELDGEVDTWPHPWPRNYIQLVTTWKWKLNFL